jgi:hypothetical protein
VARIPARGSREGSQGRRRRRDFGEINGEAVVFTVDNGGTAARKNSLVARNRGTKGAVGSYRRRSGEGLEAASGASGAVTGGHRRHDVAGEADREPAQLHSASFELFKHFSNRFELI